MVNLIVPPCFVTEVPELGRPTLGRVGDTLRQEDIANKL